MAIYYQNKKLKNIYLNGKKVSSLYYQGKKIFSEYVDSSSGTSQVLVTREYKWLYDYEGKGFFYQSRTVSPASMATGWGDTQYANYGEIGSLSSSNTDITMQEWV